MSGPHASSGVPAVLVVLVVAAIVVSIAYTAYQYGKLRGTLDTMNCFHSGECVCK